MNKTIADAYAEAYGQEPGVLTRAPGRLEILGNHTDYNEGVVLSAAVDRATYVAADAVAGGQCEVRDIVTGETRRFGVAELDSPEPGDWANYIKGLLVEFGKRGICVPAFRAVFGSTVPMSAGMSSSAALEMSMGLALGTLAGAALDWQDYARIGQACENLYVGANTGLLDQFSSLRGKAGHLVFSDFRGYTVENVPIPEGTALVVANCMVKHNLTNEYNERREACEQAVQTLAGIYDGVSALRDVSLEQLAAAQGKLDPVAYRRALHVVGEITRVEAGVQALSDGDLSAFGTLMFESQDSSTKHFENSCRELDILVEIARSLPGRIGARLSGGGFGGITVHLVEAPLAQTYSEKLSAAYRERTGLDADVMVCQAADGASVLVGKH